MTHRRTRSAGVQVDAGERRRLVAAGLLTAAVMMVAIRAAAGAASPPPRHPLILGLNDNAATVLNWSEINRDHPERSGAHLLRTGVRWDIAEPSPGVWRWSQYDRLFRLEAQRGMQILPVLGLPPTWTGLVWNQMPQDPAEFASFAARVAARYAPGGSFWRLHPGLNAALAASWLDIWNEPYFNNYSDNNPSAAMYARMMRATAIAVHGANPNERLLMETSDTYDGAVGSQRERSGWINWLYRSEPDLNRYFDAVSVHLYCGATQPDLVACRQRAAQIHGLLSAHGAAAKGMWVTEFGWSTCAHGGTYAGCVSPATQASFLGEELRILARQPWIVALLPYCTDNLRFWTGIVDTFGLINFNGQPKPAWRTWVRFVHSQQA